MSKKTFGTTSKGVEASLYEISNGGGLRVLLTDYGAAVVRTRMAMREMSF